jgi:F0F1-type ATP synthase assembly protein I
MAEDPEEEESTEARFQRVQEELRAMELPDMPDEAVDAHLEDMKSRSFGELPSVDAQFDAIEKRASAARLTHSKAKNDEPGRIAGDRRASRGLGIGLAMAYTMIGLPLLGIVIGYLINQVSPGPWIAIGVVAGFIAGVVFALFLGNREKDSF